MTESKVKWENLTELERLQIKVAYYEGEEIEYSRPSEFEEAWFIVEVPLWSNNLAYRIKPETKTETMKFFYNPGFGAEIIVNNENWEPNYQVTIKTINGVVQETATVEKIR